MRRREAEERGRVILIVRGAAARHGDSLKSVTSKTVREQAVGNPIPSRKLAEMAVPLGLGALPGRIV